MGFADVALDLRGVALFLSCDVRDDILTSPHKGVIVLFNISGQLHSRSLVGETTDDIVTVPSSPVPEDIVCPPMHWVLP